MPCEAAQLTLEESRGQGVEPLLARRVPDLHFEALALAGDDLHLEIDGDRWQVVHRKSTLLEPLQNARLAHPALPHYQDLY